VLSENGRFAIDDVVQTEIFADTRLRRMPARDMPARIHVRIDVRFRRPWAWPQRGGPAVFGSRPPEAAQLSYDRNLRPSRS
jgi:hypothetical protein